MEIDMLTADNFTEESSPPPLPPDILYSCFDENLSPTNVTPARWQSYDSTGVTLSTAMVLLLYMVIGLPCNLLIIISMIWKKLYRQPAHILLLNLAINDFLMCITYIPINVISAFAREFIFGTTDVQRCHVCQISVIFILFAVSNLHILALLSLDRFLFIKMPLYYSKTVTVKTTLIAVLLTWIYSILISIPPLFGFGEIRFTSVISTCTLFLLGRSHLTENVYFEVFSIAEAIVLPIPILIITNVWIVCIIHKQMKKMHTTKTALEEKGKSRKFTLNIQQKLNKPKNKRQLRVIKIYVAFLLSNLVTWTPNIVNTTVLLVLTYYPNFYVPPPLFVSNYLFFMSQVVVHPLIQTSMIPEIRNIFNFLLCCKRKQEFSLTLTEINRSRHSSSCCDTMLAALLPASGTTFAENSTHSKRGRLGAVSPTTSPQPPKGFSSPINSIATLSLAEDSMRSVMTAV